VLGNFHDDVISIECETNSADLYVVDAEGVYIENIAMHSYLESDVIDAINAKYGTNFTYLTMQKVTGIAIGDDCPNWDAYEKIFGDFGEKIASHFTSSPIVFIGRLENDIYHYYAIDENNAYGVLENEGRIVSTIEVKDNIPTLLLEHMNSAGYNVLTIQPEIISLEMNTIVPNWNDYLVI
jgi:hypothetical protein